MRPNVVLYFALLFVLSGCANEGIVVEKFARPSPFYLTLGIEGVYTLKLRDQQGNVRSQMVTPDVFGQYQIGDYFNDQQPGPSRRDGYSKDDNGNARPIFHRHTKRHRHHAMHARGRNRSHHLIAKKKRTEPQGLSVTP